MLSVNIVFFLLLLMILTPTENRFRYWINEKSHDQELIEVSISFGNVMTLLFVKFALCLVILAVKDHGSCIRRWIKKEESRPKTLSKKSKAGRQESEKSKKNCERIKRLEEVVADKIRVIRQLKAEAQLLGAKEAAEAFQSGRTENISSSFHDDFEKELNENKELKLRLLSEESTITKLRKKIDKLNRRIFELETQDGINDDLLECDICCDENKSVVFIPCGHACCKLCADEIMESNTKTCHICRTQISRRYDLYL